MLSILFLGCGSEDGPKRGQVSGKVTFNGTPVEGGTITFTPTGETKGPLSSTSIENGEYNFVEKPPIVGRHKVAIRWDRSEGTNAAGSPVTKQVIPAKYNDSTTLEVEVTDAGEPHDFDLKP